MWVGFEIERIRRRLQLSIVDMCNIFDVDEAGYSRIVRGKLRPTTFQLIMFVSSVRTPLESIKYEDKYAELD